MIWSGQFLFNSPGVSYFYDKHKTTCFIFELPQFLSTFNQKQPGGWFMRTVRSNILFVGTWRAMYYLLHFLRGEEIPNWAHDVLIIHYYSHKYQMRLSCTLGQPSKYMCLDKNYTRSWLVFHSLSDLRVENFLSLIPKWGVTHCIIVWWWFSLWTCIW